MGFMVEDLEQKLDSQLEINELLNTEQEEMKQDMEEQVERLRQQLVECQTELEVKEKELKKIRLSQLIIDTQFISNGQEAAIRNLNHTVRHSNTVYRSKNFASFHEGDRLLGKKVKMGEGEAAKPNEEEADKRSAKSGELDNTSEKSKKSDSQQQINDGIISNNQNNLSRDAKAKAGEVSNSEAPLEANQTNQNSNKGESVERQSRRSNAVVMESRKGETSPGNPSREEETREPRREEREDENQNTHFYLNKFSQGREHPHNHNFGLEDLDELDEILESGDDLMDIEQTAFMASSKTMLSMIDSMLFAID
mmetsp:Transcript_16552/g.28147  ORF Transcript_16552/g.28147 Transcript_16552/m.28147 type:complete len:310 (+) Transcript_16552:878-1807(+)